MLTATNSYASFQHGFLLCAVFRFLKLVLKSKSGQEPQGPSSSPWTECGAPEAPGLSLDFFSSPSPHGLEIICVCMCSSGVSVSCNVFCSFASFPQLFPDPTLLYLPNFLPKKISRSICATHIFHIFLNVWSSAGAGHVFKDTFCVAHINIFLLLHTACLESSILKE